MKQNETDKKRKIMIIIEQGEGDKFDVYLQGDTERIGRIPVDDLSSAEYWGAKLWEIVGGVLSESGVIKQKTHREEQ